jgi:hypothetical protein
MAILGNFTKQVREVLDFDISYSAVLANRPGEEISGIAVEVAPSGLVIESSLIYEGNKAKVVVSGGTDSVLYTVTVLATSSENLVYEDEVQVLVENI